MVARSVGQDGRIDNFPAGAAFPRIESADEIIEFLSVHSAFAFGTFHVFTPLSTILNVVVGWTVLWDISLDVPVRTSRAPIPVPLSGGVNFSLDISASYKR